MMIWACAATAIEDYLAVLRKFIHAHRNQMHRQMGGAGQHSMYHLRVTADIQQINTSFADNFFFQLNGLDLFLPQFLRMSLIRYKQPCIILDFC